MFRHHAPTIWNCRRSPLASPKPFPFCLSHWLDAALNSTKEMRSPQTQLHKDTTVGCKVAAPLKRCVVQGTKQLQWVALLLQGCNPTEKMHCSSLPRSQTHPWTIITIWSAWITAYSNVIWLDPIFPKGNIRRIWGQNPVSSPGT